MGSPRNPEWVERLNPIAVSFVVFFLSFLSIDEYVFTHNVPSAPMAFLVLFSTLFAVIAGYAEIEWSQRRSSQATNKGESEVRPKES